MAFTLNRKTSRAARQRKRRELRACTDMMVTMEAKTKTYNQDAAAGFIRLNALRLKVAVKVQKEK